MNFFKKKIVGAVAIAASLSFSGVAPVDFAHAGEVSPQLVLCRGDGKEVYSGPSKELQCGALPGSFYLSSTRVNLDKFTNRKSDGIYSAGDRFKISRDYSSHAGGYWKVTSGNGRIKYHTVDAYGNIKFYGSWKPNGEVHTISYQ